DQPNSRYDYPSCCHSCHPRNQREGGAARRLAPRAVEGYLACRIRPSPRLRWAARTRLPRPPSSRGGRMTSRAVIGDLPWLEVCRCSTRTVALRMAREADAYFACDLM